MKRICLLAAAVVALTLATPSRAETQTWFGFQIGIQGGSPAPPPVVFREEPHVVFVNDVYVVNDDRCNDDMFRSGNVWWRLHSGYWYRSANWRGPWVNVDVRRVPERVLVVPARHWKHHPRHSSRTVIVRRDDDRPRGRGHDRGRGRGHRHHDDD